VIWRYGGDDGLVEVDAQGQSMRKLSSWLLGACFWLVTAVLGTVVLLLAVASDYSGDWIASACKDHQKFYACLILSLAIGGNALWLAPGHRVGVSVFVCALVVGIVLGALWESRARS
jgi:H+/Cl- antiporter ClcA